ncbi:hypothetical protein BC941DRAFT_361061 [Chlamydoabsidia padenii]|nr:hypothetical protein BC941DRAFT_361061 [Chlamydoabsidia padenii]
MKDRIHPSTSSESTQYDDPPLSEEEQLAKKKQARAAVFRQIRMFALMLFVDIGLPLALYYILKMYISELLALIISGVPPLLHVIINFIIKRRVEVIGCICIFSFILSAVLTLISGNARLALLRDSTTTAVIATAFIITLIPLRTHWFKLYPMTFLIATQLMSEIPLEWTDVEGVRQSMSAPDFFWDKMHDFRRHAYIWTAIWGVSLYVEFLIKVIMIEATSLTVDQIMLYGTIVVFVIVVVTATTGTIASIRLRKRCSVFYNDWMKANDYTSHYKKTGTDNIV